MRERGQSETPLPALAGSFWGGEFSTGEMGNFQPALTHYPDSSSATARVGPTARQIRLCCSPDRLNDSSVSSADTVDGTGSENRGSLDSSRSLRFTNLRYPLQMFRSAGIRINVLCQHIHVVS